MPADRITGWVVTLLITATAFVLRVVNLGYPNKLVFDETYYAKDAYSLLKFGYERNWPSDANPKVIAGTPDVMQNDRRVHRAPAGRQVADRRAARRSSG